MARKVSVESVAKREQAREAKLAKKNGWSPKGVQDSFQNFAANVGIGTNNVSTASTYGFNPITNERTLVEWMYRGSWICQKAVDCVAEDMTREGIELSSVLKPDQVEAIQTCLDTAAVWTKLNEAVQWARLYGGSIAAMLIDGQDPATPLDVAKIDKGQFKGLVVYDRWMINPSLNDLVTEQGPELGNPKFYDVVAQSPGLRRERFHHSRCFRLLGVPQPYWQALNLNLWGASVFEPLFDRLTAFDSTTQGAAQLVYKAYLRVYKVADLRKVVSAGGTPLNNLQKNLAMMRLLQANEGITMIDEKDTMEALNYTFSGLSEVLIQFGQQISGATDIPLVRLFGQSPAGLNSTGESDLRNYYDGVRKKQKRWFKLPMMTLLQVAARSEGIDPPKGFNFDFRPLYQMSAKEKAEVGDITTRAVLSGFEAGVVSQATALSELRSSSVETGMWSSITDEDIEGAEQEVVPPGEGALLGEGENEQGEELKQELSSSPASE